MSIARARFALAGLRNQVSFWRPLAAALSVLALALVVAALIARPPPDFAERPVIAVLRHGQQPLWAIRLARSAHQIAVDSVAAPSPPPGRVYQLWLAIANSEPPRPLGLLPRAGRKIIPETPANTRLLAGSGELLVTLEPKGGSDDPGPSGPVQFRGRFAGRG